MSFLASQGSAPVPPATGVYFLAATPSGTSSARFGADLYALSPKGALTLVRQILKPDPVQGERGVDFVLADYDSRVLLVGSPNVVPDRVDMVYFDRPETAISAALLPPDLVKAPWIPWSARVRADLERTNGIRHTNSVSLLSARFIRYAGGKALALTYASDDGTVLIARPLTGRGLGAAEFITKEAMTSVIAGGDFGLAGMGQSQGIGVELVQNRVVFAGHGDLNISLPVEIHRNRRKFYRLGIHNDRMSVVSLPVDRDNSVIAAYSPRTGKWSTFNVPGGSPKLKNIGSWIVGVASDEAGERVSPGAEERKSRQQQITSSQTAITRKRPAKNEWFHDSREYYPGILFLIDPETGRRVQVQTDQGDSEILFVQDDNVWFRVNDRLFVSRISQNSITPPRLIAQDDAVADMHWAFIR